MLLRVDFPACFSAAPPDYSSVVTEEEAEQNSAASRIEEDLSAVMERPFMAYVQEFRFRPPPVYSEVRSMRVFSNEGKHDELRVGENTSRPYRTSFTSLFPGGPESSARQHETTLHDMLNFTLSISR